MRRKQWLPQRCWMAKPHAKVLCSLNFVVNNCAVIKCKSDWELFMSNVQSKNNISEFSIPPPWNLFMCRLDWTINISASSHPMLYESQTFSIVPSLHEDHWQTVIGIEVALGRGINSGFGRDH